jgi:phosphohistidine swiveling domain-containing protein
METLAFGTKAETLERLYPRLRSGKVKRPYYFTVEKWRSDQESVVADINVAFTGLCVVRSSCRMEDTATGSNAGKFRSIIGVNAGQGPNVRDAVNRVVESYGPGAQGDNHVLVQEMLLDIDTCGVAFTRDIDTLAPYYVVNYDESGSSDSVTSGRGKGLSTYVRYRFRPPHKPIDKLERLVRTLQEIETLFDLSKLDIEFAIDKAGDVWILQVRPLAGGGQCEYDGLVERYLRKLNKKIDKLNRPHIDLLGDRTIFGVMPDWNPAEMIGTKPRPLAMSLYKELVTDRVWAYQRDNYGYRNLRSHPLMVSFLGCPYIDTRVSFNSFVPKSVPDDIARRVVNAYLDMLAEHPQSHDKVEFDVVISCYHFDMEKKLSQIAARANLTPQEQTIFKNCLRDLTNNVLKEKDGLFEGELDRVETLKQRYGAVMDSEMSTIEKIYWLIEDCKRYGTLPFAGIARAAFISVQMMKSLVSGRAITAGQYDLFMGTLSTVSKQLSRDAAGLASGEKRAAFLEKYGHLRPGTYDILSPRYDEAFGRYFAADAAAALAMPDWEFLFDVDAIRRITVRLEENGIEVDAVRFLSFVKRAIEAREYAKFVFSRSVSEVLRLLRGLGERYGVSADDLSYVNIQTVMNLYASLDARDLRDILLSDSETNRRAYAITSTVRLPSLIRDAEDVYAFFLDDTESNFITAKRACGAVVRETELGGADLAHKVVFVTSADPGYDWLFSHNIACLVTMYGGANSHMAIRAAELGLPAVIGCGEKKFKQWSSYRYIDVDCSNRKVQEAHA